MVSKVNNKMKSLLTLAGIIELKSIVVTWACIYKAKLTIVQQDYKDLEKNICWVIEVVPR